MARPKNTRVCAVTECERITNGCSMAHCINHYHRFKRRGTTDPAYEMHGRYGTPEYKAWSYMKSRCYNPKNTNYKNYGGRGIWVCDGLRYSFNHFFTILSIRPARYSLDRRNVDIGYTCGVCDDCVHHQWQLNIRWTDFYTQAVNKRMHPHNMSGHTGVCWDKGRQKWVGYVKRNGVQVLHRRYNTKQEAIKAVLVIQKGTS